MMEECDNDNGLIDFSSENDSLIVSVTSSSTLLSDLNDLKSSETQGDTKCFEFLGAMNSEYEVKQAHINGQIEELPQLLETSEPNRKPKNGKCNMRKSLAWDSAFFTSSGVLDPEELTSMIEGTEKGKKHALPGIEEDISRSTDSISTLQSETLTLENLEAELFQDIRASIQKSSKANMAYSCGKAASQESDTQALSSSKKVDPGSHSRLKPKPTSKATTSSIQKSEKTMRPGSGPQTIQSVARIRDSALALPRPPLPISGTHNPNRLSTSTVKRSSLGGNRIKIETDSTKSTTGASKGTQPSKLTGLTGPRRAVPKPAPPSKPSGSPATTKTDLTRTSSCDSSTSASSNNSVKFPPRRKTDPAPQTSLKIQSRNKKPAEKSTLLAHIKLANLSSSISPASSVISEWSSESSSSTSTVDQRSKSRASIETNSSCRSIENDKPALRVNAESNLPSQNVKKGPVPAGTTSRQPSVKPSGLRMPSPKIGFFDGAKSATRTPNGGGQSQSRLSTSLPKAGPAISSPIGISSNKSKIGNAQKSASPSSASKEVSLSAKGVKGQTKVQESGTGVVKDQESLGSSNSCGELSCIDIGTKQPLVEGQKDEHVGKRTPFTEKNAIFRNESVEFSRELSVDVVEKIAAFSSSEIGLKENC